MKTRLGDIIVLILTIIFCLSAFLALREFFNKPLSSFSTEILAAVLGSIVTVACMIVMLRLQARQETEKEWQGRLFEKKLSIYQDLLDTIFKMDDDGVITKQEIQDVENKVGVACLVAGEGLVKIMAPFVLQLKIYGCMYARSLSPEQREHFLEWYTKNYGDLDEEDEEDDELIVAFASLDHLVQCMRDDLKVVEGSGFEVLENLPAFVNIPYDAAGMIDNPNKVERGGKQKH